ncbi:MipA/OmpV family protein [Pleomorphomonas oryzae]|uniref:MipA/OmpV family protein n=1 Tax=Pleomorphomonas oryzae TaxID=261934 RepID=UPI00040DF40B|nr:MipA/OmpV family protein [Pleomorphomonas oryzae]
MIDPAHAADMQTGAAKGSGLVITLGASAEISPDYPGARKSGLSALPSIDIRRFDEVEELSALDDGIDYGLLYVAGFELGPVIGFRDRRNSASAGLKGLHDVAFDVDAGAFLQTWIIPDRLRFRTEVRQALSNGSGLQVDTGVDWFTRLGEDWVLAIGPRLSFADASYMQSYFGVSAGEAAASGLSAFHPGAGLKSAGLTASVSYQISPTWSLDLYDRLDDLTGNAAKSPVTASNSGRRLQNTAGISLSHSFSLPF